MDKTELDALTPMLIPNDYRFGTKIYPANCILAFMCNYKWHGFTADVASNVSKAKNRAQQRMGDREKRKLDHLKKVAEEQAAKRAAAKRLKQSGSIAVIQKSMLHKTFQKVTTDAAWEARTSVLKNAIDTAEKYGGISPAKLQQMKVNLFEHSIQGPPSPPPTPEKFRKVLKEVIEISDDEGGGTPGSDTPDFDTISVGNKSANDEQQEMEELQTED